MKNICKNSVILSNFIWNICAFSWENDKVSQFVLLIYTNPGPTLPAFCPILCSLSKACLIYTYAAIFVKTVNAIRDVQL